MSTNGPATLVKLGDTDMTVADPAEDIRGRKVIEQGGEEIGEVEGLMLDSHESKVRFLQVASGGFLGIGEKKFLVPVDAITRIDNDHVHVNQSREHLAGAPAYDPDLVTDEDYYANVYGYYGYAPYWTAGYAYPAYPYF